MVGPDRFWQPNLVRSNQILATKNGPAGQFFVIDPHLIVTGGNIFSEYLQPPESTYSYCVT